MSNDKKQKSNWHLLLLGAVLGSVITVGAFWIYPLNFSRAKKSVVNTVKNLNLTTEITRKKKDKTGSFTETVKYQSGKTLWDFLELAGTLAVPILIAFFGHQFQKREQKRAEDNLAEEAIEKYLDSMDKLLLDEKLRKELFPGKKLKLIVDKELRKEILTYDRLKSLDNEDNDNPARDMARVRTITILRRLEFDRARRARIIHFLRDAELYEFIFKNANLSRINLKRNQLFEANLVGANLQYANLQEARLRKANLQKAYLSEANFQYARLIGANLQYANLVGANLVGANLQYANLVGANLQEAYLREANLERAILVEVEKLTHKQIKTACFWEKAIYKGEWNDEKETWIAIEPDNTKFIEELKKDKSSDPEKRIDCTFWEKQSN